MKRGAPQGASIGMTERGPPKSTRSPGGAGVCRLKRRRRQLLGEERDEMAGDGPRGKLPRPTGKEAAETLAVGRPRGNFDPGGIIVTIRALHE